MSKIIQPGYPRLESMASGQQSIAIGRCSYEEFVDCSQTWAARLGATILQAIDGPDERLFSIEIEQGSFWIAFDEFVHEICLEPRDQAAGRMIPSIHARIQEMK